MICSAPFSHVFFVFLACSEVFSRATGSACATDQKGTQRRTLACSAASLVDHPGRTLLVCFISMSILRTNGTHGKMWVWPQVPLGGPSPSSPPDPKTTSPTPTCASPFQRIAKRARGLGGRGRGRVERERERERRERERERAVGLREGSSSCNGWGSKRQFGPEPHTGALDYTYSCTILHLSLVILLGSLRTRKANSIVAALFSRKVLPVAVVVLAAFHQPQ